LSANALGYACKTFFGREIDHRAVEPLMNVFFATILELGRVSSLLLVRLRMSGQVTSSSPLSMTMILRLEKAPYGLVRFSLMYIKRSTMG